MSGPILHRTLRLRVHFRVFFVGSRCEKIEISGNKPGGPCRFQRDGSSDGLEWSQYKICENTSPGLLQCRFQQSDLNEKNGPKMRVTFIVVVNWSPNKRIDFSEKRSRLLVIRVERFTDVEERSKAQEWFMRAWWMMSMGRGSAPFFPTPR
jgi:hypothetical protein